MHFGTFRVHVVHIIFTASVTNVEISVSATSVTPKEDEYITPENVFL